MTTTESYDKHIKTFELLIVTGGNKERGPDVRMRQPLQLFPFKFAVCQNKYVRKSWLEISTITKEFGSHQNHDKQALLIL